MGIGHLTGVIPVLLLITLLGLYAGRKVKSSSDFATGGRSAGAGMVAGSIIGTLVGGASTIGTAQLAFRYGFSAWWFTLGGGIGCCILALGFAGPLHRSGVVTLPELFTREFDKKLGVTSTVLTSVGSLLSIVSQILSGIALVASVSSVSSAAATVIIIALMAAYVIFGGVWGAGMVGVAKTILLCAATGLCGIVAFHQAGGFQVLWQSLPHEQYFSLIARGAGTDLGAGLSLVLGVLTTQSYIQSVISASNSKTARRGALLSAPLVTLVGIGGIFVGLHMRLSHPDINAAEALPLFIMEYLPAPVAGAVMATLLVAVIGTGAGLALGISSMFGRDLLPVLYKKPLSGPKQLLISRVCIAAILAVGALLTTGGMGSLILNWSFMSMGLRGAVAFGPLCAALFFPGRVDRRFALAAVITGPAVVLLAKPFMPAGLDPLFVGIAAAIIILLAGATAKKKTANQ